MNWLSGEMFFADKVINAALIGVCAWLREACLDVDVTRKL